DPRPADRAAAGRAGGAVLPAARPAIPQRDRRSARARVSARGRGCAAPGTACAGPVAHVGSRAADLAAGPGRAALQPGKCRDPGDLLARRRGPRRGHGPAQTGAGGSRAAVMRAAAALAGVVLVLVPVAADPRAVYPVAVIGLICALVTLWPERGADAA